jgi:hypothetical protein
MLHSRQKARAAILHGIGWLSERPKLTIWLTALIVFAGCIAYARFSGIPKPAIHDEFSYLLAGDTFASGRLTNPTHTLWRHFETFHVLQQPTYASKYPPGQGVFLALGQILGHPILGVWLSVGLMAAAISWMLYQWVPPKWALLGSALAIVQVGFPTYWAQSYLGGAVAALGGALVYGSLRAAAREVRLKYGLLFGGGAMLLAATRPLEGILAGIPAGLILLGYLIRNEGRDRARWAKHVVTPAALVLLATVAFLGYYNGKVTGNAMLLPYQVYNHTYHMGAQFPWQEPSPVMDYRHEELSDFKRVWILERSQAQREHFKLALLMKFLRVENFLLGPGLIAILAISARTSGRWIALPIIASSVVVGAVLLTKGAHPHYAAPVMGLLLILVLEGLRRLHTSRRQIHGPRLVAFVLLAYLIFWGVRAPMFGGPETRAFARDRERILNMLQAREGDDLVIVRYGANHDFHHEWVYNRASIDSADVVWARDMSSEENRELIRYFEWRRAWLLEVNGATRLGPYPEESS